MCIIDFYRQFIVLYQNINDKTALNALARISIKLEKIDNGQDSVDNTVDMGAD